MLPTWSRLLLGYLDEFGDANGLAAVWWKCCAARVGEEGEMGFLSAAVRPAGYAHNFWRNRTGRAKMRQGLDRADGGLEVGGAPLGSREVEARVGRGPGFSAEIIGVWRCRAKVAWHLSLY